MNNILRATDGIITHQVNCQGVMGAGLALAIRRKWPSVFEEYKTKVRVAQLQSKTSELLGDIQLISVGNELFVANLFAQYGYGRNKQHTNYNALRVCLEKVNTIAINFNVPNVYIPYKMGCSLGGGDWNVVLKIIKEIIPMAKIITKK